ncbi:glycosyltransferase 87 family protein [Actinomadura scrupuli]|uniref:glycosyltransferase 87 family protein n=1 Tax=Actinomadura scrupuli TaxID=559629 RepID=UPI003D97C4DB
MKRWIAPALYGALAVELVLVIGFAACYNALDFHIYTLGGRAVTNDTHLYVDRLAAHWFTNTPFAAVLFIPLAAIPLTLARVLWEPASVAAFAWACWTALKLAGYRASRTVMVAAVALGLLLEPVWHSLFLGQINLFLLALVLTDVSRLSRGRSAGIGIGVAAAVKLTPAIFIILLLVTRRTRAAVTAGATFVLCGLLAYLIAPGASRLYWLDLFHDTTRVGAPYISNQSPYGAILRISGGVTHLSAWYLLVPLTIGIAGLMVAAVLARGGDWLGAAAVTGTTGLLVSPISWTHHWVWIMPVLVVLVRNGTGRRVPALCGYLLFLLAPMWWTPRSGGPREYGFHGWLTLAANAYLVAGLVFLAYMACVAGRLLRTGNERALAGPVLADAEKVGTG